MFMLSVTCGKAQDFNVFLGKLFPLKETLILKLAQVLKLMVLVHPGMNLIFFFNNWLTSLDLFLQLARKTLCHLLQETTILRCERQVES